VRRVVAAVTDAVLAALLGFLGFRFALWATPCGGNQGNCFPLTPAIVVCVLAALVLYFGLGYVAWRSTPGQHLFHAQTLPGLNDDQL
jgi:hypothetical protein